MKQMQQHIRTLLVILMALIVASCSTPSTGNQYNLTPDLGNIPSSVNKHRTLAISRVKAPNPLHTTQMEYTRTPNKIEYYLVNHWAVSPAQMTQELFTRALIRSNQYRDVIALPSDLEATHRLDLGLLTMRQYFEGNRSYVKVEIQARLLNNSTKRSFFSETYSETEPATANNAEGGVQAYNRAFERIIHRITTDIARY